MAQAFILWQSVSSDAAQATAVLDFSVSLEYEFELSPQFVSFQARPIVARSMSIFIGGPYQELHVTLDNQVFIYTGQSVVSLTDIAAFQLFKIRIVATAPPLAEVDFYDTITVSSDSNVTKAQNSTQINQIAATILEAGYIRFTVSALIQTIVLPAQNVNGLRIDYAHLYGAAGSIMRTMIKQSVPVSVVDGTAFTLQLNIVNVNSGQVEAMALPLIVPAGYGLYEASSDAVNQSGCSVDYKIL